MRYQCVLFFEHLEIMHPSLRKIRYYCFLYYEHLEIMHPVDDVKEGEGEGEEDPGEAVDL